MFWISCCLLCACVEASAGSVELTGERLVAAPGRDESMLKTAVLLCSVGLLGQTSQSRDVATCQAFYCGLAESAEGKVIPGSVSRRRCGISLSVCPLSD